MDPLRRHRVLDDTICLLAGEIAAGRLSGKLPSSRNLSLLLQVSRPKILEALKVLERDGLIRQIGPRRTYRVAAPSGERVGQARVSPVGRHLLYIVEEDEVIRHEAFEVLLMLATRLHPKGLRISSLSMNFGHSDYRPKQWKRAIEGYAPDRVIVWSGRAMVAEWLQESGIPSLFIGGDKGRTSIPVYATSSREAIGHILRVLFEAGHERIWFPFCNRPDAYADALASYVAQAFGARGLAFSQRWNMPASPYRRPDVIVAMFEQAWRNMRPTALMFHDWREYLAVSSVLRREGLDIPRDMSVALMGDDSEMSWHQPELAHFVPPLKRIANACAAWAVSEKTGHIVRSQVFQADWQPGASIAAPRRD